ncbi:MAG: transposase [Opitutaceae bacterium]|nr:transposase [Opitutaceae bacterium]
MPTRQTSALHQHRFSAPAVRYFVTICTQARKADLTIDPLPDCILNGIKASDALGDSETLACCVMPDHVHWLFALGRRLTLGRIIARLKAQTREILSDAGLTCSGIFSSIA